MPKKKTASEAVPFEEGLNKLEDIVRKLEDGQLGLSESLACYEEGVRYLKQCHAALSAAEQKILLLTSVDEAGRATAQAFAGESADGSERSGRSSRRAAAATDVDDEESDVDTQKGLF